jgi:hypothetical protein
LTRFTFRVTEDGEYWFALATVDRNGRQTPEDVNQEPPALRVVVDRQAPVVQVQPGTSPEGETILRCTVQDANPDPLSLRAVARLPQGDVPLEAVPGQPGTFRLRGAEQAISVRVIAGDLAGNVVSRELSPRDLPTTSVSARSEVRQVQALVPRNDPQAAPAPLPPLASAPAVAAPPRIIEGSDPGLPTRATPVNPAGVAPAGFAAPAPTPTPPAPAAPAAVAPVAPTAVTAPAPVGAVPAPAEPTAKPTAPANRQLLNSTHASVEYRIDQVGPSGVGKVEVYVTTDMGQTWQRLQETTERRSPTEVELPGEGVYGLRLVITNGNGFGGTPPRRGDAPDCWIEVDSTTPFVQLKPTELVSSSGQLDLHWTANDKNLGPEPVSLHYRTRPDAPWQLIARNLRNDGNYRWQFPRDIGSHFYFKVEVADLAGNIARVESPTPIVLDMTEPRASVVSVSGSQPRGN